MKKYFILSALFTIVVITSFAQRTYSENRYESSFGSNLEAARQMFEQRISDIQNDNMLTPHQQRKTIRAIKIEESIRLKSIKRWNRKERKVWRKDGISY